ncbi:MAG: hypothetical protein ACREYC_14335 [Gammaproteobacteria bacterium]
MLPDGATFIDLRRHGEAEGGARYRGSTDDPLTAEGWAQMWAAVREDWLGPGHHLAPRPLR